MAVLEAPRSPSGPAPVLLVLAALLSCCVGLDMPLSLLCLVGIIVELVSEVVLRNNEVNVFEVVSQISARRLVSAVS